MAFNYSMEKMNEQVVEHARAYNFRVQVMGDFPEIHEQMVVSVTTPKMTIEPIMISWTSTSYPINGKATFDPITLTLREKKDGEVIKAFLDWASKAVDIKQRQASFTAEEYKDVVRDVEIFQLDEKGKESFSYKLYGCWVDTPTFTYTYEGSAIVQYDVTINYMAYTVE